MAAICRELHEYDGADRAQQLDASAPECICEACSLSAHGPVNLREFLLRFVISPVHVNSKGTKPRASVLSHAETIGLSSFRDQLVSDQELLSVAGGLVAKAREANARAGIFGVLRLPAMEIKSDSPDEVPPSPVYCVYDVPNLGVESHVDVYQRVAGVDDDKRAARRQWLFNRVDAMFIPVNLFRNGLLLPWAPDDGG